MVMGQGRLTGWAVSDSRFGLTEGPEEEYCSRMNRRTRHDSSGSTFATPYEAYGRYEGM